MRVETVQANGAGIWVVGLVGIRSEQFRRVTLTGTELAGLQIREATRTPAELRRIRGVRPKRPIDLEALLRLDRDRR